MNTLSVDGAMNLRDDFEAVWKAGGDYDTLLALVRRHQQQGLTATESYWILHQLWLDNGFNDCDECGPLQNELEYVLEKLWYEQPATK